MLIFERIENLNKKIEYILKTQVIKEFKFSSSIRLNDAKTAAKVTHVPSKHKNKDSFIKFDVDKDLLEQEISDKTKFEKALSVYNLSKIADISHKEYNLKNTLLENLGKSNTNFKDFLRENRNFHKNSYVSSIRTKPKIDNNKPVKINGFRSNSSQTSITIKGSTTQRERIQSGRVSVFSKHTENDFRTKSISRPTSWFSGKLDYEEKEVDQKIISIDNKQSKLTFRYYSSLILDQI